MKRLFAYPLTMLLAATSLWGYSWQEVKTNVWAQYRVMYNNSNIGATENYDFFRQRMRLEFDMSTEEGTGGVAQIEYRGGWGGSSPASSDPRGIVALNPFNRLSARGIRYGYIYTTTPCDMKVRAGILPESDQLGDTLFSADWDWNVGGVTVRGEKAGIAYRFGLLRLQDDLSNLNADKNGDMYILDANLAATDSITVGGHVYTMAIRSTLGDYKWYGVDAKTKLGEVDLNGFVISNTGETAGVKNSGTALKVEAGLGLGDAKISALGIMSTGGDNGGDGFMTPMRIVGTAGYWGYTYIFSPHGPSDVNDFGAEIGGGGYGLTTIQAKVDYPLTSNLGLQVAAGTFSLAKEVTAGLGTALGTDIGAQLSLGVAKDLALQFGYASASIGDAGMPFFGQAKKTVNEGFARFQLEFK